MNKLDLKEKTFILYFIFAHPATIGCQINYDGLSIVRENDQPTDQKNTNTCHLSKS